MILYKSTGKKDVEKSTNLQQKGFPCGSDGKASACSAGDPGSIPGLGRSPGEGKVKSESEVAQLCPTLSDPMDCSPPGSSIHGIFQARVLEWGAIAFSF